MKTVNALILSVLFSFTSISQDIEKYKGVSTFKKYDETYITPNLRGKHGASIGVTAIVFNLLSETEALGIFAGGHVGYNYLILKSRKRLLGKKELSRDEVLMGFGAHLYFYPRGGWVFNINYLNPIVALRGKLLSYYLFNEIGLGMHYTRPTTEELGGLKPSLTIEPLRIRFGKSPLNLCAKVHVGLGNSLLEKQRFNMGLNLSLKYYIYKTK